MDLSSDIAVTIEFVSGFQPPPPVTVQPPTNLQVTPALSSIQLSWTASLSAGVIGYKLRRREGASIIEVGTTAGTSYTFSGLNPNTTYILIVSALTADGESAWALTSSRTLEPPTPKSTIGFTTLQASAIEGTTAVVQIKRTGGDNSSPETIPISENGAAPGSLFDIPDVPIGGVDYNVTWPGGVDGYVTFAADSDTEEILVDVVLDAEVELGESVNFGIIPSPTDAYLVNQNASSAVVEFVDPPNTEYEDSVIEFTALANVTATQLRVVVGIDPVPPGALPVFEFVSDSGTTVPDVFPGTRLHNGLVDKIVVTGNCLHGIVNGTGIFDQQVILRSNPAATLPASVQHSDLDISALRFELRGVPTHGTIEFNPFAVTRKSRIGKWSKEVLYWGFAEPPGRDERIGCRTQVMWYSDADMLIFEVQMENNLYDPDYVGGHYVPHPEVAGDVWWDSIGIKASTIPAGWEIGNYHHNETSQVGGDFMAAEGGLQVIPSKSTSNIKRFYLRKTATCGQTRAEGKYDGAGLGQVVSGPLKAGTRFAAMATGVPDSIWEDRAAARTLANAEWSEMLGRIKSGSGSPESWWGTERIGHYHASGNKYYTDGGGYYLFAVAGLSNTTGELNCLRHYLYMAQGRNCTSIINSNDGSIVTPQQMADSNGGKTPWMTVPNGAEYHTWIRHMRPDSDTVHGTGSINPNCANSSNNPDFHESLMPVTNPWNIPGAVSIVSTYKLYPMRVNSAAYGTAIADPPQGTHHRRHMAMLDGLVQMTCELMHMDLAQQMAAHTMHCYSQHPIDPLGTHPEYIWHDLEWPLVGAIADIEDHPRGRSFWGGGGGGGLRDNSFNHNPSYMHRAAGELADAVALGAACCDDPVFRAEMLSWAGKFYYLLDLRCSPVGWGAKDHAINDSQGSAHLQSMWGATDNANQRGGWPSYFVGLQSFWQMLLSLGIVGLDRRLRPRIPFASGQVDPAKRVICDTFMEQVRRANARGRKVPSAYGIVIAHNEGNSNPNDSQPEGFLAGVGTGNSVPNWIEEWRRPSQGGPISTAVKTTLREEALQWAAYVAAYLEQHPEVTDIPIIDITRDILEGIKEEDTGAHWSLTYAQAAEVTYSGYSFVGGNTQYAAFFPLNFYRQRRIAVLGLMQNAEHYLERFPHWGSGDKTNILAAPAGFQAIDTPGGIVCSWNAVPGATKYRVEWMENRPQNGAIDGFVETANLNTTINGPVSGFNCFFRVMAINGADQKCISTRLAPVVIGSGQTGVPETDGGGGGGGGGGPVAPTLDSVTGGTGGFDVTFTVSSAGSPTIVVGVESSLDGINFTQVGYLYLSDLAGSGPQYTASIAQADGSYLVRIRSRDGNAAWSTYAGPLPVVVGSDPGGGGGSGSPPTTLVARAQVSQASVFWTPVTGAVAYDVAWGTRRDTLSNVSRHTGTSAVLGSIPLQLVWISVRSVFGDGSSSDWREPAWVLLPDLSGVNPYVRPIERPQLNPFNPSLGHVGCGIDTANLLAPPTSWLQSGAYVLTETNSPAVLTGYKFDKPVRVKGSSLVQKSFVDCEMNAYGPLAADSALYSVWVADGDEARIDMERCTVRYGKRGLLYYGGTIKDVYFENTGEDGIHVPRLIHPLRIEHVLAAGIGNIAACGYERNGLGDLIIAGSIDGSHPDGIAVSPPHGDGVQIRAGNAGGSGPPTQTIEILGCDLQTLYYLDPDYPVDGSRFGMSSAIFLETAVGPINNATIAYNWTGSASNSIQIVNDYNPDAGGPGVPNHTNYGAPTNVTVIGNVISEEANNAIDSDVVNGSFYANTLTNGDPV